MSTVRHVLFGAIHAPKSLLAVNTLTFADSLPNESNEPIQVNALLSEGREAVFFLQVLRCATMRAEGTYFMHFFLVNQFELRH